MSNKKPRKKKKPKDSELDIILTYDYGNGVCGNDMVDHDVINLLPKLDILNNSSNISDTVSEIDEIVDVSIDLDIELDDDIDNISTNIELDKDIDNISTNIELDKDTGLDKDIDDVFVENKLVIPVSDEYIVMEKPD